MKALMTKAWGFPPSLPLLAALLLWNPGGGTARAQQPLPWWNDAVFYELFVRSFYDGNGDGIGDFQGLTRKLDYLNDGDPSTSSDLGVTALWLMPVFPSPSYHGYDVTDYKNVNSQFGSLSDFRAFIDAAHARGIRVIIDFVMNHSSSQHPWFTQSASNSSSPYRDWYIWRQTDPGYRGSWGQQVWYPRNSAYYFAMFWSGMPDINLANTQARAAIFEAAAFWLDSLQVDGFRLDAVKHLFEDGTRMENVPATFTFLREFRQFSKSVRPDAMAVGEAWSSTYQVAPYVDGTGIDLCFEFQTASSIIQAVRTGQPAPIQRQMDSLLQKYPPLQYATFLTNHDMNRVANELSGDPIRLKLAAAFYLTLPGVPFLYYGEEIGMTGAGADENKRTPMHWTGGTNAGFSTGTPWRALNSDAPARNVAAQQADSSSLWHWYRSLIAARNACPSLRRGDYTTIQSANSYFYGYARRIAGEACLVLHNFQQGALARPVLFLDSTGLAPGEHDVLNALTGRSVGKVTLNQHGGFSAWMPEIEIPSLGTAVLVMRDRPASVVRGEEAGSPVSFVLHQNYPNPFNPSTVVRYHLPERSHMTLAVFDVLGREVALLADGVREAGSHQVRFDAQDLPSGFYFCRLQARSLRPAEGGTGASVRTRTMLLLR